MQYLTNQQIFDKVVKHLIKQNEKSKHKGRVVYINSEGLTCSAMCLVSRKLRSKVKVNSQDLPDEILAQSGIRKQSFSLVYKLQGVHDAYPVINWKYILVERAREFRLKIPSILKGAV